MHHHLGDFPRKLEQHMHAVYEYVVCPPVGYPELKEEMWCHRYYLRNLCDERFADWPIVEHIPLLQVNLIADVAQGRFTVLIHAALHALT